MPNVCREQFNKRYFWFYCDRDEKERFYVTQWSSKRLIYLIYRIAIWAYQIGWLLAYYVYNGINYPAAIAYDYLFLTRWGYVTNSIYFTLALILAAVGFSRRHSILESDYISIKVLRSTTWLFQTVGQAAAIIITILFWAALTPYFTSDQLADPFNIDSHAMNSVLYLIDIFMVASPIRLLHVIYIIAFAIIYITATLIYHATGITSAVYPVLDWQNNPGLAAGLSVGVCFAGTIIVHSFVFGLHLLRCKIADSCCSSNLISQGSPIDNTYRGTDNIAYEDERKTSYITTVTSGNTETSY